MPYKALILCTGNSARSIIGEYLLNARGKGRFEAFSAGAAPTGKVNPLALWVLKDCYGIDASDARSKSWDEFKGVNFDFVITVCDNAREACPIFPGHPVTAHFGSPDPAAFEGTEEERKKLPASPAKKGKGSAAHVDDDDAGSIRIVAGRLKGKTSWLRDSSDVLEGIADRTASELLRPFRLSAGLP